MAVAETSLPDHTVFGFQTSRQGPITAADFESWPLDPDSPMELLEGWLLPMSPGDLLTGRRSARLAAALLPLVDGLGWDLSQDARHRLPWPDGREAAGFRLEGGVFVPIEPDADGFIASPLLGARLRLVPAAVES